MSKEWYLMGSPNDVVSGYEGEALLDFGAEGFNEALETEIALTVQLCNYDLTECRDIRVFIQGVHQDTKLKTFSRQVLAPIGTCKAGMYIYYKNRYWLITGIVDDNQVFEKAIMIICNYKLSWLNSEGKVIERWINAESASQYNNGESNMRYYFVRSDQLMVYMPDDDESLMLNSGARFIIDQRCTVYEKQFDGSQTSYVGNPVIVYKLTRSDTVLDNYIDSGVLGFIFTQTEQLSTDGYYYIGGNGYWLCDVPEPEQENDQMPTSSIIADSDFLYIDLEPSIYTAMFFDQEGNVLSEYPEYTMQLSTDYNGKLQAQMISNSLHVYTSDYSLNGKTYRVILQADGYETVSKEITIKEFI